MSHKHCVFCGEEVPVPRPTSWSMVCTSDANTLQPDSCGHRYHAVLVGRTEKFYEQMPIAQRAESPAPLKGEQK